MTPATPEGGYARLAHDKLCSVLGHERATAILERHVAEAGPIETAEDLALLADALRELGGFEATIGAMLGVQAAMLGARRATRGG